MTHQGVTFYQDGGYFIKTAISYKLFSPFQFKGGKKNPRKKELGFFWCFYNLLHLREFLGKNNHFDLRREENETVQWKQL